MRSAGKMGAALCHSCCPFAHLVPLQMEYGGECHISGRPYTVFRWKPGAEARYKKTIICQEVAKAKNVCQVRHQPRASSEAGCNAKYSGFPAAVDRFFAWAADLSLQPCPFQHLSAAARPMLLQISSSFLAVHARLQTCLLVCSLYLLNMPPRALTQFGGSLPPVLCVPSLSRSCRGSLPAQTASLLCRDLPAVTWLTRCSALLCKN